MKIKIGTRGSELALRQTELVAKRLMEIDENINVEIVIIKTKGDLILDKSIDKIGGKGIFTSEIEKMLSEDTIDLAVHSMKDMPTDNDEIFNLYPVLKREDHRDALIFKKNKMMSTNDLLNIATGSKRRETELKNIFQNVKIYPIRGNINTRIDKMINSEMDATVLANAAINRLDIKPNDKFDIRLFELSEMISAPCQGMLAVQIKKDHTLNALVKKMIDNNVLLQFVAERTFLKTIDGSCHLPIGAYLEILQDGYNFHYLLGDTDSRKVARGKIFIVNPKIKIRLEKYLANCVSDVANKVKNEVNNG
ncbi:MAG: hydroxymethylbilane synthase [Anaerorhabdus sp.]